jgi:RNA polymerase sigma-70 factor (ECF subfamily)
VRRFLDGDQAAFDLLVERHRARLIAVARSILHNTDDAEEIAQDALLCAHRGLAGFRGDCSVSTWLHHITRNLARNRYWYFRRRRRHLTSSLDAEPRGEPGSTTLLDVLTCDSAGPVREVAVREFHQLVGECMTRIDPGQRTVLHLSHQLPYEEIARRLGIKCGTVKSRIARARASLREHLRAACPDFGADAAPLAWLEPARDTRPMPGPARG